MFDDHTSPVDFDIPIRVDRVAKEDETKDAPSSGANDEEEK